MVRPDPITKEDPLANPDIWRGYVDSAAGAVGDSLRAFPRKNVGPMFTTAQRDAIFRAYDYLVTVRDRTLSGNKKELDDLAMPGNEKDPNFEARKAALLKSGDARMKSLAGTMGRLGLLIGFLEIDLKQWSFPGGLRYRPDQPRYLAPIRPDADGPWRRRCSQAGIRLAAE